MDSTSKSPPVDHNTTGSTTSDSTLTVPSTMEVTKMDRTTTSSSLTDLTTVRDGEDVAQVLLSLHGEPQAMSVGKMDLFVEGRKDGVWKDTRVMEGEDNRREGELKRRNITSVEKDIIRRDNKTEMNDVKLAGVDSEMERNLDHEMEKDRDKAVVGEKQDMTQTVKENDKRPKRKAALNRPDYLAMHNHIPTPTGKWLELINDPEKYGARILEDNFPRIPGDLLTKAWIESPLSDTPISEIVNGVNYNTSSTSPKGTSIPRTSVPSASFPHPTTDFSETRFPPTLFYGPSRVPLVIRKSDGGFESMGGRLPSKSLKVGDIVKLVGEDRTVDVIDVASQHSSQWSLTKWAEYIRSRTINGEPTRKVYNVITLEISGTDLAKRVTPPRLVREIDWVDNFWEFGDGGKSYPKVQLYCLMGAKGAWTDWHVDFAASSVYYSIHTGSKVFVISFLGLGDLNTNDQTFFFIRPTESNLKAYATWSGSAELQQSTWLGNMCDEVRKVTLTQGDTMIIPAGYIHAVYTPEDAIVFGGNFLHSYDIDVQLRMRQIEIDTKVPQRFRFPQLDRLCWYVASRYRTHLTQLRTYRPRVHTSPLHPRILQGLTYLASFLISQTDILEDPTAEDKVRKSIWDRVPVEVGDPVSLARELQWRVLRELPKVHESNEMGEEKRGMGKKMKRKGKVERIKMVVEGMRERDGSDLSESVLGDMVGMGDDSGWTEDVPFHSSHSTRVKRPRSLLPDHISPVIQNPQDLSRSIGSMLPIVQPQKSLSMSKIAERVNGRMEGGDEIITSEVDTVVMRDIEPTSENREIVVYENGKVVPPKGEVIREATNYLEVVEGKRVGDVDGVVGARVVDMADTGDGGKVGEMEDAGGMVQGGKVGEMVDTGEMMEGGGVGDIEETTDMVDTVERIDIDQRVKRRVRKLEDGGMEWEEVVVRTTRTVVKWE
ncbi:hypothetical protein M231_05397 [Tremella mesenterica]|uniref:[histone H3]-dimethyl-L-lysine(36) demethylase n=1 Tax=Tremella mesenterica TaxID=5217 RepID=A0A4Q1BI65_TREME|nr:hypothetical protein M231_05397 [Tremella mesenterica]